MSKLSTAVAALLPIMLGGTCAAQRPGLAGQACLPLDAAQRYRLIRYVQGKYNLPVTLGLYVGDSAANELCYRKLDFRSQDSHRPFRLTVYASPDLRFLSRDLMDDSVDPACEERKARLDMAAKLDESGNGPSLGPKDAPVTIALFSDFQCPYCANAASGLIHDVFAGDGTAVRLVFHYFPLLMHAWARPAAEAAACARQQGDSYFWMLHDYFFEHQKDLKPETLRANLIEYAAGIHGIDPARLNACIEQKAAAAEVDRDLALGASVGVTGTPTMFVNGERVTGYRQEEIRAAVERARGQSAPGKEGAKE